MAGKSDKVYHNYRFGKYHITTRKIASDECSKKAI